MPTTQYTDHINEQPLDTIFDSQQQSITREFREKKKHWHDLKRRNRFKKPERNWYAITFAIAVPALVILLWWLGYSGGL